MYQNSFYVLKKVGKPIPKKHTATGNRICLPDSAQLITASCFQVHICVEALSFRIRAYFRDEKVEKCTKINLNVKLSKLM